MADTGGFVIVWENNKFYPQFDYHEIYFKLYDANGSAITSGSANLLSGARYPDVAMDGYGNFTIVWMQEDSPNIILARRYDSNGTPKADPCQANSTDFFSVTHPAIAADSTGHFLVAWDGNPGSADQDNILARRYKFDGTPVTNEFTVNTATSGTQENPDVAINNQRQFVIVFSSEPDPNTNIRDIIGQRYDEFANSIGDEFQINTYEFDDQKYPAVTIKEDGEFITVWQSDGQDGSGWAPAGPFRCSGPSGAIRDTRPVPVSET